MREILQAAITCKLNKLNMMHFMAVLKLVFALFSALVSAL